VGGGLAFLVVLVVMLFVTDRGASSGAGPNERTADQTAPPTTDPKSTRRAIAVTGDLAVLDLPGGRGPYLATTDAAYDEMLDAENRKDTRYMGELLGSGKVHHLPNGVQVRVLEASTFSRKVRVLDGPLVGLEGWVQEEFVRPVR
jgi:hypothetical protein